MCCHNIRWIMCFGCSVLPATEAYDIETPNEILIRSIVKHYDYDVFSPYLLPSLFLHKDCEATKRENLSLKQRLTSGANLENFIPYKTSNNTRLLTRRPTFASSDKISLRIFSFPPKSDGLSILDHAQPKGILTICSLSIKSFADDFIPCHVRILNLPP